MYEGPGLYQHYKGSQYQVLGLVLHTETEEVYVIYTAFPPSIVRVSPAINTFARPLKMFNEIVCGVAGTPIDGVPRFRRIG